MDASRRRTGRSCSAGVPPHRRRAPLEGSSAAQDGGGDRGLRLAPLIAADGRATTLDRRGETRLPTRSVPAAAAVLGAAYLIAAPETADMAAHTYRTWLWNQVGFATWNAQWYGGHHMAGYSLLYPPLAALAGTAPRRRRGRGRGGVAVRALARRIAPTPGAAALAAWLFLGGVMSNVVIGRMPFTLGIALAVGAWASRGDRGGAAALLSLASVWASPVAGVFLARRRGGALAGAAGGAPATGAHARSRSAAGGGRRPRDGRAVPRGGSDHFVGTAFWPMLLVCARRARAGRPGRRIALWAAALYVIVLVAAFALPNPLGQNALRPGVVLGPALLVCSPARARRARPSLVVAVALLYLQWLPAVRAVEEARGDPSTKAVPRRGAALPRRRARAGRAARGAAHAQPLGGGVPRQDYPLARGWHRQLDRKVNPLFYDNEALTAARYERWLRDNAVRWVALPDAPLDFSAEEERRAARAGPALPGDPSTASATGGSGRCAPRRPSRAGALTAAGADGFDLEATAAGAVLVRQHGTPYWTSTDGDGCVSRTTPAGRWSTSPARARCACGALLRARRAPAEPRCADGPERAGGASAVNPPCRSR